VHQWLLFLHIGAVLGFILQHGIYMTAMWAMRREADPGRIETIFYAVPNVGMTRLLLAAVVGTGLLLGFIGPWWRQWWMWLSFAILAAMWGAMYRWGGGFFGLVQAAAENAVAERQTGSGSRVALEAYERVRRGWQPVGMMALGIGGLGVILWLMVFKPF